MSFWDSSAFDYEAEGNLDSYGYTSRYDSNYLTATVIRHPGSGTVSPVPGNSPQATLQEYPTDSPSQSYPMANWEASPGAIVAFTYSNPSSPIVYPNPGSPVSVAGSIGSPTAVGVAGYAFNASIPSSYYFRDRGEDFWGCYDFHPSGENGPYFSLRPHLAPTDYYPSMILHVEDPQKQDSARGTTHKRFICLHAGCDGAFRRSADLERHVQQVHNPGQSASYYCDYRRCNRSESSPENNPFGRKDHYRDHLRDYHNEDLPKREGNSGRRRSSNSRMSVSAGNSTATSRNIHPNWWRCTRCLVRNFVQQTGWTCRSCNSPCESERQATRERLLSENRQ